MKIDTVKLRARVREAFDREAAEIEMRYPHDDRAAIRKFTRIETEQSKIESIIDEIEAIAERYGWDKTDNILAVLP